MSCGHGLLDFSVHSLLSPFHPQKIKGRFTGDPKLAVPLLGGQPLKDKIVFVLAKGKLKPSYSFRAVSDASQQRALNRSDRMPSLLFYAKAPAWYSSDNSKHTSAEETGE